MCFSFIKIRRVWIFAALMLLGFQTCTGPRELRNISQVNNSNCQQQTSVSYIDAEPTEELNINDISPVLKNHFSIKSLHIAHAIGIMPSLEEMIQVHQSMQESRSMESRLLLLEANQKINSRIHMASLEISAVASEMDCEEERAEQIANFLKQQENRQSSRLTVAAIGVGAIGAIVTGVLLLNGQTGKIPEIIGITTGFTEAILGFLILRNGKVIHFQHKRNPIKEIWEGPEKSAIFPPALWYYLNRNMPEAEGSHREQLIKNWIHFAEISSSNKIKGDEKYPLFFGEGGLYNADQLFLRANMLDQTEAQVSLMQQDLSQLSRELQVLTMH